MTTEVKKKTAPAKKAPVATKAHEEKVVKAAISLDKATIMSQAVGRRKSAVARVRLVNQPEIVVNGKAYDQYFTIFEFQKAVTSPLVLVDLAGKMGASIKVEGGGIRGQAEAIRHGITRALIILNPDLKKTLRSEGFVTRDSRGKERKKPGLRSARRAPQFSKR